MAGTADMTPESILGMAAAAQQRNIHPIAKSLVKSVPRKDWPVGNVAMSSTILGRGVKTQIGENYFTVGNPALMQDEALTSTI